MESWDAARPIAPQLPRSDPADERGPELDAGARRRGREPTGRRDGGDPTGAHPRAGGGQPEDERAARRDPGAGNHPDRVRRSECDLRADLRSDGDLRRELLADRHVLPALSLLLVSGRRLRHGNDDGLRLVLPRHLLRPRRPRHRHRHRHRSTGSTGSAGSAGQAGSTRPAGQRLEAEPAGQRARRRESARRAVHAAVAARCRRRSTGAGGGRRPGQHGSPHEAAVERYRRAPGYQKPSTHDSLRRLPARPRRDARQRSRRAEPRGLLRRPSPSYRDATRAWGGYGRGSSANAWSSRGAASRSSMSHGGGGGGYGGGGRGGGGRGGGGGRRR